MLIGAILISAAIQAQPFKWQWSVSDTTTLNAPDVADMVTDVYGNSYVFGSYYGTASFGSLSPITSVGENDLFVVKYNNMGVAQWAATAGGTGMETAMDIAIDASGNLYIVGHFFSSTIDFGGTTHDVIGQRDIFVARLDPSDGSFVWSQRFGSNDFQSQHKDNGNAIACDAMGNVYVSGGFRYTLDVPGIPTIEGCSQYNTGFLMKLDPNGNGVWSRRTDCTRHWSYGSAEGQAIEISPAGHLYLGLRARGDTIFYETDTILNTQTGGQAHDAFLARYDLDGNYQWARSFGAYGYDDIQALAADEEGNCYIAIHREGGYGYLGIPGISYAGSMGGFKNVILKYSADGDPIWGTRLGNSTYDHDIEAMELEGADKLMVAGWHQGNFQFDSIVPIAPISGNYGIWVARYDTSSVLQEYFTSRYYAPRGFKGMGMDAGGNTYLAGYFQDSLSMPGLQDMDYDSFTHAMFLTRFGDVSTSIPMHEQRSELEIYPVPSNGRVTVRSPEPFTDLVIYNAMGIQVYVESFTKRSEHAFKLDEAGYFTCSVFNRGRRVSTKKIVVVP